MILDPPPQRDVIGAPSWWIWFTNLYRYVTTGNQGIDTGSANAYVVSVGQMKTLPDGFKVRWKAKNGNTGASTLNVSGTGAIALNGSTNAALSSGAIVASVWYESIYSETLNTWRLL